MYKDIPYGLQRPLVHCDAYSLHVIHRKLQYTIPRSPMSGVQLYNFIPLPSCVNIHIYITMLLWTTVTSLKATWPTLQLKVGYDKGHIPLKVNFIYLAPLTGHIAYRTLDQVEIITERKWLETDYQPSVYLPQTINQFTSTHAESISYTFYKDYCMRHILSPCLL